MAAKAKIADAQELILFRLSSSYGETLHLFGLTEMQYHASVKAELERARSPTNLGWSSELERAVSAATAAYAPPNWVKEAAPDWLEEHNDTISRLGQILFRIESEYLSRAYHDTLKGTMPSGSLQSPSNLELLVAEALESDIRGLRFAPRYRVIELLKKRVINDAPKGAKSYLKRIRLGGVMVSGLGGSLRNSPLAILQIYDAYLQRTKQYAPLFDLKQRKHLHPWDIKSQGYGQDYEKVELRIAHTLEEDIQGLRSASREDAIGLIEQHVINAPGGAAEYLNGIGLEGVMTHGLGGSLRGSPLAILQIYDAYLQRTKQYAPLFDLKQRKHLHPWDITPQGYIQDYEKVELRIAHTLEEDIQGLRSASREDAIGLIETHIPNAPGGAQKYLNRIGLSGVISHGLGGSLRNSPRKVVRIYDHMKMGRDGCSSMFDSEQHIYFATQPNMFGHEQLIVVRRAA